MYLLNLVKEGIVTVIGWVGQVFKAMIDWGWTAISELSIIKAVLTILGAITGTITASVFGKKTVRYFKRKKKK